jgi:NodT family efflux transporter outer membrane factor (OMF) lipoprotein
MPEKFKEASKDWVQASPADQMQRGNWWKSFKDPVLDDLIEKTNLNNFQIQAAVARYQSAQAYLAVNNAGLYPQVAVGAQGTENRQSIGRPLRGANQPNIYDNNFLGAGVNYELDLWGRVRSSIDSASASAQASQQDLESLRLAIQTDVAISYIRMRGAESQLSILRNDLMLYEKQALLMNRRYHEGINSGVDFYRVQGLVESGLVQEKQLETQRALYEHVIALLIGEPASSFNLPISGLNVIELPQISLEIPSTLLERRPDVAAAERRVAATNADIGVARSAFFPVISLSALGGFQTANQASLLAAPNAFWTIGPTAFLTIFDGGRRSALVDQAVAKNSENIALYKNTVLSAIKEVEDVLVESRNREHAYENVENSLMYANKTYDISTARYKEGIAGYLEIVDAAIEKSKAESQNIDFQSNLLVDRVRLIKALGGYWAP